MPRRRPRKGLDTGAEDTFVAYTLRLLGWGQQNVRALVLGGLALAVLIAGIVYYIDFRHRVTEAASAEIQQLRAEVRTEPSGQTVDRLRSFLSQFGGTEYATEGRVLLAYVLLLQGRSSEAIEPAREAAKTLGDDPLATRAGFLLAAAYEEEGDTASAISVYEEIGRKARYRRVRSQGLEGAARLRAASGDVEGALALYEQLTELAPEDSPVEALYRMRAAELRAERSAVRPANGEDV